MATVRDGYSERTSISKVRDKEVVNFAMSRAKGASDVTVYDEALEKIAQIEAENRGEVHPVVQQSNIPKSNTKAPWPR